MSTQIINVKDKASCDAITLGLALNGYYVTCDDVTDENYKSHWEIKYCLKDDFEKSIKNDS